MISTIIWNVRGISKVGASNHLKSLVKTYKPPWLAILEPLSNPTNLHKFQRKFPKYHIHPNCSNKIWLFTLKDISITIHVDDVQFLHFSVHHNLKLSFFTVIYASCFLQSRRMLWSQLALIGDSLQHPWLVGGDLNMITKAEEKRGGCSPNPRRMAEFSNMIHRAGLFDMGFSGSGFTWRRGRILERLDRILANNLWIQQQQQTEVIHLPRLFSDHNPLLIQHIFTSKPKYNFRFLNMWTKHPTFLEVINQCWNQSHSPSPWTQLWHAHKTTQKTLKEWNYAVFGHIPTQIKQTQNQICSLEDKSTLNDEEWVQLEGLHSSLQELVEREEAFLAQQASMQSFLEGDRNSKFYHAVIKARRTRNHISTIKLDDGSLTSDPMVISENATAYFSKLMQNDQPSNNHSSLEAHLLNGSKTKFQNINLTHPPSMDEVTRVLNEMNGFKAAGSDGFSAHFYQVAWHIIGDSILKAITDFFNGGKLHPFFLDTTLVLIPKSQKPLQWSGYRPIALTSVLTRIISKLINNRLSPFLDELIEPNQAAFVKGRQIMDNIAIAQELCRDLDLKTRGGNLILKLDVRKAFDTMDWGFLHKNLTERGFQPPLLHLVQQLFSDSNYSILLNGEKHGYFKASRGVKQGDPLSPSLFILGMDYLSKKLNQLFHQFPRLRYKHKGKKPINHLLFADDILIFCNGSRDSLKKLMDELEEFQRISGMFFNANKCVFISGKATHHQKMNWIQQFTGFSPSSLPITYLGAKIFKGKATDIGNTIINSIKSKIQSWEHSFLSSGARLSLIQSTLNSIPVYTIQAQQLSKDSINQIEKVFNKFLWSYAKKGIHWASWKRLARPKAAGGMGLKSIHELYENFSIKRWIRFREQKCLWATFMYDRYCQRFPPKAVQLTRGDSPTWKRMLAARTQGENYIFWMAGKGDFNLWTDHWIGDSILADSFQNLADSSPDLKVANLISNGEWDLNWAGSHLNEQILHMLKQLPPPLPDDQIKLKGTSMSMTFSKVLQFNKWKDDYLPINISYGWSKYIKPSISLFGWKLQYKLLPLDNILKLKGIKLCSRCQLCHNEEESFEHLFKDCAFTSEVLLLLGSSMDFPQPTFPEASKPPILNTKWSGKLKRTLGVLICWFLWCARNQNKYDESKISPRACYFNIWSYLRKIIKHESSQSLPPDNLRHYLLTKWLPPHKGVIKVNIDAQFSASDSSAGIGGIFRDWRGRTLLHFCGPKQACSPLHAEALALYAACTICAEFKDHLFWIETDSLQLVQHLLIYNDLDPPWFLILLLRKIKSLLSFQQIYLSHIFREANKPADYLASLGAQLNSVIISRNSSVDLQLLSHGDLIDLPHLRVL